MFAVVSLLTAASTAAAATARPAAKPAAKKPVAKTCAAGDLDRCYAEALALHFGEGVPKDTERALTLFKENCAKGHTASCATADAVGAPPPTAVPTVSEVPVPTRRPRVDLKTTLTEGCEAGDSAKCLDLARRYEHGQPPAFEKDLARTLELLKKACDGTSGEACHKLAKEHLKKKEAKAALERGVELDGKACEAGNLGTCWRYGQAYRRGEGVKENDKRAREIFEAACASREAWSCTTLGDFYHHEEGVRRDRKKAYEYYGQGCELGAFHACFGQALVIEGLVRERQLPAKDLAVAAALLERACEKYTPGCWKLARAYHDGIGVPKDKAKAKELLELACSRGHRESCAGQLPANESLQFSDF